MISKKPPTLDVPKAKIDVPVPPRSKPEASMVPCGEMPGLPESLKSKPGKMQAEYILSVWGDAVSIFSDCSINQSALTKWINHE